MPLTRIEALDDARRLQLLIDGVVDYAVYLISPQGRIATWNTGAQRLKGYSASEIIGQPYATFFTEEDRRARSSRHRSQDSRRERPLGAGGVARPQGRHAVLGARRRRCGPQRAGRGDRVCEDHPRHHGARADPPPAGAGERGPFPPGSSRLWSTTRFSSSIRRQHADLEHGRERIKGYRPRKSSASISADSTPRRIARPAFLQSALTAGRERGTIRGRGMARSQGRHQFWASVVIDRIRDDRRQAHRVRQGHARHLRTEMKRNACCGKPRISSPPRRRWRRSGN